MKTAEISATNPLATFTKDLILRDGAMLRIRALTAADREGLQGLFSRCSPETIRLRFLRVVKALSDDTLDLLFNVDGSRNVALVVTQGENTEQRIVAVGRYHALIERPEVAEVSFLVEDAMQRNGIGTQLLDALAELARLQGFTRFAADVLSDNHLMLDVFRKAGYALSGTTSYGVTHLEFPIAYSELAESRAVAQEAEAQRSSLRSVLAPRSIAIIGASRALNSVGGSLFRNLLRGGFMGVLYPINPRAKAIAGVRTYATLAELPEPPELAFIVVPSDHVLDSARECAAAGVRALCVISAGFAESGSDGAKAQDELLSICRASGMRLVGPNCLGMINTAGEVRMLGTFAPADAPLGNLAIGSQSGALGLALIHQAAQIGLGISSFVSIGNRADVSGNDLLHYWEADDATEVILLYLESFGNPRHFARIARRVARRKPIVAVKAGRTVAGAKAASSHTAALAGSEAGANALFAQTGIIRVDTLSDFFSLARLLATQPVPAGKRVGILTNAGGPAILATDAAEAAGLKIPKLSEATQAKLRALLPAAAAVANPVDMIASAGPAEYRACLETLCDEPDIDALLIIFIPPLVTPSADIAQAVSEVLKNRPEMTRTVTAVFLDPQAHLTSIDGGKRQVPVYEFPESAVEALAAAARYGVWRNSPLGNRVTKELDRNAIDEVLATNGEGWLTQADTAKLLAAAGINIVQPRIARSAEEAAQIAQEIFVQTGRAMAFKVNEPTVLHKTDVGGVLLNVNAADAREGFLKLAEQLAAHDIPMTAASIMPMAQSGVEVLAGITLDPVFGPLVAVGSGGVLVELLDDLVFRALPLTDQDARLMVRETRAYRLLKGYRGAPAADVAAVENLLLSLGALAEGVPRIAEIDLNPVLVHPAGEGLSLIDARVRLMKA